MPVASLVLKVEAVTQEARQGLDKVGQSFDGLSRRVEQRGRKINEWMNAHKALVLGAVAAIGGMVYKMSKYSPAMQRFAAQMEVMWVRLALALDPYLTGATQAFIDMVDPLVGALESIGVESEETAGLIGKYGFQGVVVALLTKIHPLVAALAGVVFVYQDLQEALGGVEGPLGNVLRLLTDLSFLGLGGFAVKIALTGWDDVKELVAHIKEWLSRQDWLEAVVVVGIKGWRAVEEWFAWVARFAANPLSLIVKVTLMGWKMVEEWFGWLGTKDVWKSVVKVFLNGWKAVEDWFGWLGRQVSGAWRAVVKVFLDGWKAVEEWFGWLGSTWLGRSFKVVVKVVGSGVERVIDKLKELWKWLSKLGGSWQVPVSPGAHVTGTVPMWPGDQAGVPFVQRSGLRYVHRGEEIKPAALSRPSGEPTQFVTEFSMEAPITIHAAPETDLGRVRREMESALDSRFRAFEREFTAKTYDEYARRRR